MKCVVQLQFFFREGKERITCSLESYILGEFSEIIAYSLLAFELKAQLLSQMRNSVLS